MGAAHGPGPVRGRGCGAGDRAPWQHNGGVTRSHGLAQVGSITSHRSLRPRGTDVPSTVGARLCFWGQRWVHIVICLSLWLCITSFSQASAAPLAHPHPGDGAAVARPQAIRVLVLADGGEALKYLRATTVGDALREAGLSLRYKDEVRLNGLPAAITDGLLSKEGTLEALLTERGLDKWDGLSLHTEPEVGGSFAAAVEQPQAILEVRRAIPVNFHDGNLTSVFLTTADEVSEVLRQEGVKLAEGDLISPVLSTPVAAGMNVYLHRAKNLTLRIEGKTLSIRSLADTVGEFLESQRIELGPLDKVNYSLRRPLEDKMFVRVVRVREDIMVENIVLPNKTTYKADVSRELDEVWVAQQGANGLRRRWWRLRFEDGVEVTRAMEQERVESFPQDRVIAFGTKVVVRTLSTPEGPMSYWRKLRVFATWYDARQGDKPRSSPYYGYTRLGWKAEKGVVAIDPTIIPFYTKMYVPGYGVGIAVDTGGAIKGMRIDLAFSEGEEHSWGAWWTDIYLLTPASPASQINYILPGKHP